MNTVSFSEALRFWLKLGFISFGGPAGQIAIMHEELVTRKKWVDEQHFRDGLSFCTLLPGPEAQQLAIYLGWYMHGIKGGITAGLLFILPSIAILLGLSIAYVSYGNHPAAYNILIFLRPAVLAIILSAFLRMAKSSLQEHKHFMAAFGAFVLMTFFDLPFPVIIIVSLIVGWLLPEKTVVSEEKYILEPVSTGSKFPLIAGAGFLLWLLPMALVVMLNKDFEFWSHLSIFFTKAACVTFGGAYAVLPYVADKAVNTFHWLSTTQMVDGLALGETTPGPLIMVLAFVGFMAGYGVSNGSLLAGTAGLLMTTWYTFLPGFVFVLLGAPFVSRISGSGRIKGMMHLVNAAVAGVILNLAYHFGSSIVKDLTGKFDLTAILITVTVITLLRRQMVTVPGAVGLAAAGGLIWHFVQLNIK